MAALIGWYISDSWRRSTMVYGEFTNNSLIGSVTNGPIENCLTRHLLTSGLSSAKIALDFSSRPSSGEDTLNFS